MLSLFLYHYYLYNPISIFDRVILKKYIGGFMLKILMNDCCSQVVDIIRYLHKDNSIKVVYLSSCPDLMVESVADEFYLEDSRYNSVDIKMYKNYLLDFCLKHNIDIFIPFKKMDKLADYTIDFVNQGVKVLISNDTDMFKLLNSKVLTYNLLKDYLPDIIPSYKVFNSDTKTDIFKYINYLRSKGKTACFKYVNDIGGSSFRIVISKRTIEELNKKSDNEKSKILHSITDADLKEMLFSTDIIKDILVMEYADGKEVSCDCLKTTHGNIVIPRIKLTVDTQIIEPNKELLYLCNQILDITDYNAPCNIQFKQTINGYKLLEVNTRMSGGVIFASEASGINIPLLSVYQLLGKPINFNNGWVGKRMVKRPIFDNL